MYKKLNHQLYILINFFQSHDRHHPLISCNPDLCLQGGELVLAEAYIYVHESFPDSLY